MTPELLSGKHVVSGRAVDAAGNTAYAQLSFDIDGLPAPTVSDYTKEITGVDPIFVKGATQPDTTVVLYVETPKGYSKVSDAKSDANGTYTIAWQPSATDLSDGVLNPKGLHAMYVVAKDDKGHVSKMSVKLPLLVGATIYSRVSQTVTNWLTLIVILAALAYLLYRLIMKAVRHFQQFRREIGREAAQAESIAHKAFALMREDIKSYVDMLSRANEKRALTEEEKQLVKLMKRNLNDAEKAIAKSIVSIENKAGR